VLGESGEVRRTDERSENPGNNGDVSRRYRLVGAFQDVQGR
jgi:hypothetical protein